jgi:hypothetical protein
LLLEGLDVDLEFATALGTGTSSVIQDPAAFSGIAQTAASLIARNASQIDLDTAFGLSRESIIAAMFNDPDALPEGETVAGVNEILERLGRQRTRGAQGFSRAPTFTDALGRLRVQGFGT